MHKNSGYIGFSRSVRSQRAIDEGKRTATDFAQWVRQFARFKGCTAKDVSIALSPCEWHHTSKFCNRTNYYDPRDLLELEKRAALADRIRLRKAAKNGSLLAEFTAEARRRGLTVTTNYEGSTLYHAVDANRKVIGECSVADDHWRTIEVTWWTYR